MALAGAGITFQVREVQLKNKPPELLAISPKGTVPVLVLPDTRVIEESLDIVHWALKISDPWGWLDFSYSELDLINELIERNDFFFKVHLDHYKYADRFPEHSVQVYRSRAEEFLSELEQCLKHSPFLFGSDLSIADIAIFPFVRQFYNVDKQWFEASPYTLLNKWLLRLIDSLLFKCVMNKYAPWEAPDSVVLFESGLSEHTVV